MRDRGVLIDAIRVKMKIRSGRCKVNERHVKVVLMRLLKVKDFWLVSKLRLTDCGTGKTDKPRQRGEGGQRGRNGQRRRCLLRQ